MYVHKPTMLHEQPDSKQRRRRDRGMPLGGSFGHTPERDRCRPVVLGCELCSLLKLYGAVGGERCLKLCGLRWRPEAVSPDVCVHETSYLLLRCGCRATLVK